MKCDLCSNKATHVLVVENGGRDAVCKRHMEIAVSMMPEVEVQTLR